MSIGGKPSVKTVRGKKKMETGNNQNKNRIYVTVEKPKSKNGLYRVVFPSSGLTLAEKAYLAAWFLQDKYPEYIREESYCKNCLCDENECSIHYTFSVQNMDSKPRTVRFCVTCNLICYLGGLGVPNPTDDELFILASTYELALPSQPDTTPKKASSAPSKPENKPAPSQKTASTTASTPSQETNKQEISELKSILMHVLNRIEQLERKQQNQPETAPETPSQPETALPSPFQAESKSDDALPSPFQESNETTDDSENIRGLFIQTAVLGGINDESDMRKFLKLTGADPSKFLIFQGTSKRRGWSSERKGIWIFYRIGSGASKPFWQYMRRNYLNRLSDGQRRKFWNAVVQVKYQKTAREILQKHGKSIKEVPQ